MSIKEHAERASAKSLANRSLERQALPQFTARDPRVRKVTDFMNANLHRRIRLTALARMVNLSPFHLSYLFKSEAGLPPGEYLRRLRMEKARQLLASTFLSVKEVMASCGYNSKNHFARHFKSSFGVSPSEYRRSIKT